MTITKKLVEAHNGTISVKSEENMGTTFCIKMPVST
ncbi:ATP-binding protein [Bacillus sp. DX1.1]